MPTFLEAFPGLSRDGYYGLTVAEYDVLAERISLRIAQRES